MQIFHLEVHWMFKRRVKRPMGVRDKGKEKRRKREKRKYIRSDFLYASHFITKVNRELCLKVYYFFSHRAVTQECDKDDQPYFKMSLICSWSLWLGVLLAIHRIPGKLSAIYFPFPLTKQMRIITSHLTQFINKLYLLRN
jgi:hypothetical protein